MARLERKARYVGTWREDNVTDALMRQILARAQAEKGQKVKVKLSKDGLAVVQTVVFQETALTSFSLRDVYFMTVNQRHPACLLAVACDPVRKYVIVALKAATEAEAHDIISTFQSLKDNPTINAGNVVLRPKGDGRWTLRERSQLNADRHLQDMFKEYSEGGSVPPSPQPNGTAGGHAPALGDSVHYVSGRDVEVVRREDGVGERARTEREVDRLPQELREIKTRLERHGSVNSQIYSYQNNNSNNNNNKPLIVINNNNNHNTSKARHSTAGEVHAMGGTPQANGGDLHEYYGISGSAERPGVARVAVEDFRGTSSGGSGVVSARSNYVHVTSATPTVVPTIITTTTSNNNNTKPASVLLRDKPTLLMSNGTAVQRRITAPPAKARPAWERREEVDDDDQDLPVIVTSPIDEAGPGPEPDPEPPRPSAAEGRPAGQPNGRSSEELDYVVYRHVLPDRGSTLPAHGRRESVADSLRSGSGSAYRVVTFDPEAVRRNSQLRTYRRGKSGVPTSVLKPIEETYGHYLVPVAAAGGGGGSARPSILKPPHHPHHRPQHHQHFLQPHPHPGYAATPQQQGVPVYVAAPTPASQPVAYVPRGSFVARPAPMRRSSRPHSVHVMEGDQMRVYRQVGGTGDNILL